MASCTGDQQSTGRGAEWYCAKHAPITWLTPTHSDRVVCQMAVDGQGSSPSGSPGIAGAGAGTGTANGAYAKAIKALFKDAWYKASKGIFFLPCALLSRSWLLE